VIVVIDVLVDSYLKLLINRPLVIEISNSFQILHSLDKLVIARNLILMLPQKTQQVWFFHIPLPWVAHLFRRVIDRILPLAKPAPTAIKLGRGLAHTLGHSPGVWVFRELKHSFQHVYLFGLLRSFLIFLQQFLPNSVIQARAGEITQ
jgi:hypothetical protein